MQRLKRQQHVCRYRREEASQKSGQHIPEEVLHGVTLLPEDGPEAKLIDLPAEVHGEP